jgi:glycerate 2-kinase
VNTAGAPAEILTQLYRSALRVLQPGAAVRAALDTVAAGWSSPAARLHLLAVGKAAVPMARAALEWSSSRGYALAGGVCVSHVPSARPLAPLWLDVGNHPIAGADSLRAARALQQYIALHIGVGDHVLVLLSGGTSALIGAPCDESDAASYTACVTALLGAGLTIGDMNLVRRRLSQWGGGRLGDALQSRGARVEVIAISDVPGDDIAMIGSGPCVPDVATSAQVSDAIDRAMLSEPDRVRIRTAAASLPGAAPARSRLAGTIPHHIVSSSTHAAAAVMAHAVRLGLQVPAPAVALVGDAHRCGAAIAEHLLAESRTACDGPVRVYCWHGEPTLAIDRLAAPSGGRMQALALAAAAVLHTAPPDLGTRVTLLSAGTDGRDGTTDAAGAIVTHATWSQIAAAGHDPGASLRQFASHSALRSIGALIPAFDSGTNVNDLVIGIVTRAQP